MWVEWFVTESWLGASETLFSQTSVSWARKVCPTDKKMDKIPRAHWQPSSLMDEHQVNERPCLKGPRWHFWGLFCIRGYILHAPIDTPEHEHMWTQHTLSCINYFKNATNFLSYVTSYCQNNWSSPFTPILTATSILCCYEIFTFVFYV